MSSGGQATDRLGALAQRRGWALRGSGHWRGGSSRLTFFSNPQTVLGSLFSLESVWTIRDTRTFPLRVGLGQRGGLQGISGPCLSHTATPAPSRPAHLLRNVPLESLRRGQHRVGFAQTVPRLCVAQMEGVGAQDKLQGKVRLRGCPCPATPPQACTAGPLPGPVTSQRCPMIGASAHACSVLSPSWPFLKEMSVKDLSNHLQREEKGSGGGGGSSGAASGGAGACTCCSSCRATGPCRRG